MKETDNENLTHQPPGVEPPEAPVSEAAEVAAETATESTSEAPETSAPEMPGLAEMARRDPRLGYMIVDMMAGVEADEAVKRHFGASSLDADAMAEAEQRGYLKARNELAHNEMNKPGLWSTPTPEEVSTDDPELAFLSYIRPSVWD